MPTYDYQCDACGHTFEEWQSFKDDELTKCPKCKKKKLRRLISGGAALIFKGSGFYETDYRKDSYKDAAKKDADAAKPTETPKADDTKAAEAKPAEPAKPEPKAEAKPKKKPK